MEHKISTEKFIDYLRRTSTKMKFAEKLQIGKYEFAAWFDTAWKDVVTNHLEQMDKDFKQQYANGIPTNLINDTIQSIVNALSATRKSSVALNETEDEEDYDEEELLRYEKDYKRVLDMFKESLFYNQLQSKFKTKSQQWFLRSFLFAFDLTHGILFSEGMIMPSDMPEMYEQILQIMTSYDDVGSLFKSDEPKNKQKKPISKTGDGKPIDRNPFISYGNNPDGTPSYIGLNESAGDWTEAKLRKLFQDEFKKEIKKGEYMTKKEVKDIIRKTIVKQYKFLWEKSAFFINQI